MALQQIKNTIQLAIKRTPVLGIFSYDPMIVNKDNFLRPDDSEYSKRVRIFGSNGKTTILFKKDSRGIFLKPTEKINKFQFEELFGFGPGCIDYDKNRVVYYPHGSRYYPYGYNVV